MTDAATSATIAAPRFHAGRRRGLLLRSAGLLLRWKDARLRLSTGDPDKSPCQIQRAHVRLRACEEVLLPGLLPLLCAGCTAVFTNLTPQQQPRNPNDLYRVAVAFQTRQQTLR